jgi:putative acetyltransferase
MHRITMANPHIMHIRTATKLDRDDIRSVYLSAFPQEEGEATSQIALDLLSEETHPQTFSFVAETKEAVVGHVAFSPVTIDASKNFQGYILAPLGVKTDYQNHRIGTELVESGMQQLSKMDIDILFVYGDPKYYSRFDFCADAAARYIPPYTLQYPFGWQAIVLNENSIKGPPVAITCVTCLCDPKLW